MKGFIAEISNSLDIKRFDIVNGAKFEKNRSS